MVLAGSSPCLSSLWHRPVPVTSGPWLPWPCALWSSCHLCAHFFSVSFSGSAFLQHSFHRGDCQCHRRGTGSIGFTASLPASQAGAGGLSRLPAAPASGCPVPQVYLLHVSRGPPFPAPGLPSPSCWTRPTSLSLWSCHGPPCPSPSLSDWAFPRVRDRPVICFFGRCLPTALCAP